MKTLLLIFGISLFPLVIFSDQSNNHSKLNNMIEIANMGDNYYQTGKGTINYEYICVDSLEQQKESITRNANAKLVTYMNHSINFAFNDQKISCIVYDNEKSKNIVYEKWIYDGETTWLLRTRKGNDNIYVPGGFIYNGIDDFPLSDYDLRFYSTTVFNQPIGVFLQNVKDGYFFQQKINNCTIDFNIMLENYTCTKIEISFDMGFGDDKIVLWLIDKNMYRIKRQEVHSGSKMVEYSLSYNDNEYIATEVISRNYDRDSRKLVSERKLKRNDDWVFNEVINDNVFDNNIFIKGQWVYDTRINKRYKY